MLTPTLPPNVAVRPSRRRASRAAGVFSPPRAGHHGLPAVACDPALSAGGLGAARFRPAALFAGALPWTVIGFWNATIGFVIMRFAADPARGRYPGRRAHARRRADHRVDRDPVLHPQRTAGARDAQSRPDAGRARGRGRGGRFHLYLLSDTNDADDRRGRGGALCGLADAWRDRIADHLPAAHRQYRLQGRQYPRFLRALGRGSRIRPHARRRQFHAGRRDPAPGAHHAGRPEARHLAEPRRRHAVDQRVRAHLPVRHAARHALLHDRQRLVAGRLRPLLGAQRGVAARAVHRALPPAAAAAEARRRSAAIS